MWRLTEAEVAPHSMGHMGLHLFSSDSNKTTTTKNVVKPCSLLPYLFVATEKIWASETALFLFGVKITS